MRKKVALDQTKYYYCYEQILKTNILHPTLYNGDNSIPLDASSVPRVLTINLGYYSHIIKTVFV